MASVGGLSNYFGDDVDKKHGVQAGKFGSRNRAGELSDAFCATSGLMRGGYFLHNDMA